MYFQQGVSYGYPVHVPDAHADKNGNTNAEQYEHISLEGSVNFQKQPLPVLIILFVCIVQYHE
jgi:hypothetical protein